MSRLDACLTHVLKHEGGYSNHPADPGGATNKGVTQAVYDAYRRGRGLPTRSVRLIEDAELQDIYREGYWDEARCGDLPCGVDYMVFDLAVNSGPSRAAKFLQRAVGVTADGKIGPVTLKAVRDRRPADIIASLYAQRRSFYQGLSTFGTFGKGWMRRLEEVFHLALGMARGGL